MAKSKTKHNAPKGPASSGIGKVRPHVLLGVGGGVAAYKAVDLASRLTAAGARVATVMTENARRFVGPKSFEAVTCSAVYTTMWSASEQHQCTHVGFVDWADIIVVAPATADVIGKVACGICDDLLSTTLCACWAKPVLLAPAMNENMWKNPAVQRNVAMVQKMGFRLVGPVEGRLADGTRGMGRMSEPAEILAAIEETARQIRQPRS
jgi:phosphopantothenoylcysteine synthetase/decarboxylase